jgi:2,3-bisphosphoglycerate-dependent phosphoglycerate mutase
MSLFIIRHGETPLNAARTLQPADTPLGPRGLAQAAAVAARLAALRPAAVLSSDLPRALQTAQPIAAAADALPVQTSSLLHERNFGDLRGRPYDGLGFDPLTMADAPRGGESLADFLHRCDRAFDLALQLQSTLSGPLVVVTHGLVIRTWLQRCLTLPVGVAMPGRIGNTSVTQVEVQAPHAARLVDCTAHLQGLLAEDGRSLSGG